MKKDTLKSLLLTLPFMFMVSCKPSLKVTYDFDRTVNFTAYKTFSLYWLTSNQNVTGLNEDRIWNFIRSEMIKKGYREDNRHPDLLLNAVGVVKNKNYVVSNSNVYYGGVYRPYFNRGGIGMAYGNTTFQTSSYKEGRLVIDAVDAKSNKLIWQGTGNAAFEKQPKDPDEAIRASVSKILASLPPVS